jgi:hypothetical protein
MDDQWAYQPRLSRSAAVNGRFGEAATGGQ